MFYMRFRDLKLYDCIPAYESHLSDLHYFQNSGRIQFLDHRLFVVFRVSPTEFKSLILVRSVVYSNIILTLISAFFTFFIILPPPPLCPFDSFSFDFCFRFFGTSASAGTFVVSLVSRACVKFCEFSLSKKIFF